jgi:acetylornithine/succinyldiaminopimelate/putrescine aminotransferase
MNIEAALKEAMSIDGALGACLVDWESGMSLGAIGGGEHLDLDVAAAGNTEVIRAKLRTMHALRLDDSIEDILISLSRQYHLIRPIRNSGLFLYAVLDRQRANLALARHSLRLIESDITI